MDRNHRIWKIFICADKHIFIDKNWDQIFCEDLKVGDEIQTSDGIEKISSVEITKISLICMI